MAGRDALSAGWQEPALLPFAGQDGRRQRWMRTFLKSEVSPAQTRDQRPEDQKPHAKPQQACRDQLADSLTRSLAHRRTGLPAYRPTGSPAYRPPDRLRNELG